MATIQYFFLILTGLLMYRTIFKFRSKEIRLVEFFWWSVFWLAIAVVVVYPKTASLLAIYVGIGRGADLVVYASLLLIFYLLFRLFMRLEKMEQNITKIVTAIALKEEDKE